MAKYNISFLENKNEDWKLITLETGETDVSVNRKSKKGEIFPNFDDLKPGSEVEGELWQSTAGKWYLFPPRAPKQPSNAGYKQKVIEETMQRKEQSIGRFQTEKELSIKISSTFRAAVDTAIAEYQENRRLSASATGATMEQLFKKWRDFYWTNFDINPLDKPPF